MLDWTVARPETVPVAGGQNHWNERLLRSTTIEAAT
jgi:hypothetical protein